MYAVRCSWRTFGKCNNIHDAMQVQEQARLDNPGVMIWIDLPEGGYQL